MVQATEDVWEVLATARAIRRFTDEPVDDVTLGRCLEAATWAPSGGNVQHWRFVVLDSPEMRAVVQQAADAALKVIEPIYGMSRPAADDTSRNARRDRATYELHDHAGERTSVLFVAFRNAFACRLPARRIHLPRRCRTSTWPPGPGSGRLPDQLGGLRRRTAAAPGDRDP